MKRALFKKVLQETKQAFIAVFPKQTVTIQETDIKAEMEAIIRAIMCLKNGKNSGPERIYAEILKSMEQRIFFLKNHVRD